MSTLSHRSRSLLAVVPMCLAFAACSGDPVNPGTENPGPENPAPATRTAIHRLFSQPLGDHLYGQDPNEGAQSGYVLEARDYFYLASSTAASHVPLYRCRTVEPHDHFLSTVANCEGASGKAQLGYVATTQISGTVPLYRLYRAETGNTFYTMSTVEADNAVSLYSYAHQGVTGYVYTTP